MASMVHVNWELSASKAQLLVESNHPTLEPRTTAVQIAEVTPLNIRIAKSTCLPNVKQEAQRQLRKLKTLQISRSQPSSNNRTGPPVRKLQNLKFQKIQRGSRNFHKNPHKLKNVVRNLRK